MAALREAGKGRWPAQGNPVIKKWSAILRWSIGSERWSETAGMTRGETKV